MSRPTRTSHPIYNDTHRPVQCRQSEKMAKIGLERVQFGFLMGSHQFRMY